MQSFPRRFTLSPHKKCEVTLPLWLRRSNQVNTFNCSPVNFAYSTGRLAGRMSDPGRTQTSKPKLLFAQATSSRKTPESTRRGTGRRSVLVSRLFSLAFVPLGVIPCGAAPLAVLPLRIAPLGIVPPSVVLETLEGPIIIFRVESDGSRRWMKAAANFEDAKALVKVLAASSPGEYVITNLTGDKTSINFEEDLVSEIP